MTSNLPIFFETVSSVRRWDLDFIVGTWSGYLERPLWTKLKIIKNKANLKVNKGTLITSNILQWNLFLLNLHIFQREAWDLRGTQTHFLWFFCSTNSSAKAIWTDSRAKLLLGWRCPKLQRPASSQTVAQVPRNTQQPLWPCNYTSTL